MGRLLVAFVCLLGLAGGAVAGPNFHPGNWEITTTTEMVGMPGMNVPAATHRQCIREENLVPRSEGEAQECSVSDVAISGDTVSWKVVCSGQNGSMEGTGSVTYRGETMSGTMDLVIQGADMRVKNTIRGRRIGDCK
ncbi:MAG: DUF3617 domain-containing protein [Desulfosudaceae bacterium]